MQNIVTQSEMALLNVGEGCKNMEPPLGADATPPQRQTRALGADQNK